MTKTEDDALKMLDQVCAQVALSRDSHAQVLQAIQILKSAIQTKEEPKIEDES